jgi:hypothetical protein
MLSYALYIWPKEASFSFILSFLPSLSIWQLLVIGWKVGRKKPEKRNGD